MSATLIPPTSIGQQTISFNSRNNVADGAFLIPISGTAMSEKQAVYLFPTTVLLNGIVVECTEKQPLGKNGWEIVIREDGKDTNFRIQITNGEIKDATSTSLVRLRAGALVTVQVRAIGTPVPCLIYVGIRYI